MEAQNLESLIKKAIANEEEARSFYLGLFDLVSDPIAKETLKFLAGEELAHKEFLLAYLKGEKKFSALPMDKPIDYHVAQYAAKPDPKADMNSSEVYLVAAHRELNSYKFYKGLAAAQPAGEVKDMLLSMANQELKHKEKVEYLYSNTAFPQTAGG
ncbi:MAG: ferritin family protein [Candidatus Aminicenantes bacterium]|nr:ferritin family protein [Candidatus Aminicenantes bacterium]